MELFFPSISVLYYGHRPRFWLSSRILPSRRAIISIVAAALFGLLFEGDSAAYFHSGSPYEWPSAGVTNLGFVYWDVKRYAHSYSVIHFYGNNASKVKNR